MADLLIEWEDLYRQGQDTPADVLCKEHPELASTLTRQIAALKRVSWLDKKLDDDGDDPANDLPDDPSPPRVLAGRYRLDVLVATGGFAEVWRAYDQELLRNIAIKIPKQTVVGSADSFLAEARRVARLKHPAIVPVHDVGLDGDNCFFVSEYVEGGSLADRLTQGGVSGDEAVAWITAIAGALDHAHRSGVIHRDVKPANILIDAHGRALLADFGIAQSSMKTGEFAPSLGTLRYMAPEQLAGHAAVPQSDVYSLAIVLHEALTGETPYSSADPNVVRQEIASGRRAWPQHFPRQLIPVMSKALHAKPLQRHESAAQFAADLKQAWTALTPQPPARKVGWLPVAALTALAGAGAVVFYSTLPNSRPAVSSSHEASTDLQAESKKADNVAHVAHAWARVLEAKTLFEKGEYAAAIPVVRKAIELDNSVAQYHHYLGACFFNLKEYEQALQAFDTASRLDPSNASHHLHRGYCLTQLGRQEEAVRAFDEAGGSEKPVPQKTD